MIFDISFSAGLLTFHANYQVEDRAGSQIEDRVKSQVPKMSMTFDMFYNRIHHILYL